MTTSRLSINLKLDLTTLANDYGARQRLQVRDFLEVGAADWLLGILEREIPWNLAFNDGDRVVQLTPNQLKRLSPQERNRLAAGIAEGARRGYQFVYSIYPLLQAYFDSAAPHSPLFPLFEWLNGPEFLGFTRRLTGLDEIVWADAQATKYSAGHFLKYHTDETPSEKRLAAYIINFTKDWGRDWGGFLQFFDVEYDVDEAYRPIFNAMNVFTIPADHSVGMVSSYVQRDRLSITGWLRGDQPPRPIGGRG